MFLHKRQDSRWLAHAFDSSSWGQRDKWIFMSSRVAELHCKTLFQIKQTCSKITYSKKGSRRTRVGLGSFVFFVHIVMKVFFMTIKLREFMIDLFCSENSMKRTLIIASNSDPSKWNLLWSLLTSMLPQSQKL